MIVACKADYLRTMLVIRIRPWRERKTRDQWRLAVLKFKSSLKSQGSKITLLVYIFILKGHP